MCGIAVAIDWEGAEEAVRDLIKGVQYRGDVTDPVVLPRANSAMCTRRLRIVDAENAVQPQLSFDGRLLVTFNGEIYNHAELRQELMALGVTFRTRSDTEVLANALQVWGAKAFAKMNGMYAFVALDIKSGEFLAARDPFGVKPLYLIQSETGFLFCSEITPLLNATATGDVLLLPPGYLLTRKFCAAYKTELREPFAGNADNDPKTLDRLLSEAVLRRLPQDLPVATLLSGGIDSTLVAHYARKFRADATGYFLGSESAPDFQYVSCYAEKSGVDLRIVPFDENSDENFHLIGTVVSSVESFEPNVVRGSLCSYFVSKKIHEDGFRVALSGEGADELFCGYLPLEYGFLESKEVGRGIRQECLDMMHRTSLQRLDRSSMRFRLEVREPFLDMEVAAHCLDLSAGALVGSVNGEPVGKLPLRDLYNLYPDQLPALIRDRRKVPFDEGAGLDLSSPGSALMQRFEDAVSDADFADGKREFQDFEIQTKEELYYLWKLTEKMDVRRVPHMRERTRISLPTALQSKPLSRSII
jgi:asparagine synthase (glutamine-hydrolysing)